MTTPAPASPRLLVIAAGPLQVPIIRRAREMGAFVVATDRAADAPGLRAADAGVTVAADDAAGLERVARAFGVTGVVSEQTDAGVLGAATVAARLGLPGISVEAARAATDKWTMRRVCAAAGIPVPAHHRVRTLQEAERAASALGFPVVLKPTDAQSSRGVVKLTTAAGLADAWPRCLAESASGTMLVEEMMVGVESSVEAFVGDDGAVQILGICRKDKSAPPASFDLRLTYPGDFPDDVTAALARTHEEVVRALGISCGLTHGEYMVTTAGVRLIEIAARGCGARVATELLPAMTGVDVVGARLRQALGQSAGDVAPRHRRAGRLEFLLLPPGRVRAVDGLDEARSVPGVLRVDLAVEAGDRLRPALDGRGRHGAILAVADDVRALDAIVAEARARLRITIDPDAP